MTDEMKQLLKFFSTPEGQDFLDEQAKKLEATFREIVKESGPLTPEQEAALPLDAMNAILETYGPFSEVSFSQHVDLLTAEVASSRLN